MGSYWFGHKVPPHWLRQLTMGTYLATASPGERNKARIKSPVVAHESKLNGLCCAKVEADWTAVLPGKE